MRLDRRPLYVACFLAALVVPQVTALGLQFVHGFRPFSVAPGRVPLSWDMFAIKIARCDVRWEPPLHIGQQSVRSIHDTGWPLEWDASYDTVGDYRYAARYGCVHAVGPTTAHLSCFTDDGLAATDEIPCP